MRGSPCPPAGEARRGPGASARGPSRCGFTLPGGDGEKSGGHRATRGGLARRATPRARVPAQASASLTAVSSPPTEEATRVGDPAPPAPGARRARARAAIAAPDTTRAIGLAAATMVSNLVAVAFTVVFARLLGADGYGSLAALFNLTVILFVPGYALQVATARAGTLGRLGRGGELSATLRRWTAHLAGGFVLVALAGALARDPLAALLNIDQQWAAAAVPLTAAVWLLLCVQRGLLQAARAYRAVGWSIALEATGRLLLGLVFLAAGGGVTGTYLGTTVAFLVMVVALDWLLRRRLGRPIRTRRATRCPRSRALRRCRSPGSRSSRCCRTST